jgi:hypothetical protein
VKSSAEIFGVCSIHISEHVQDLGTFVEKILTEMGDKRRNEMIFSVGRAIC